MHDNEHRGRDKNGRFLAGYSQNPLGRPRKKPQWPKEDIDWFKNEQIEIVVNGEIQKLTRHQVLRRTMFEQAIKGKSPKIAMLIFAEFEKSDEVRLQLLMKMGEIAKEVVRQRKLGAVDSDLLEEFELHYFGLGGSLP
jgi:Family of unknown function (DUF5681)